MFDTHTVEIEWAGRPLKLETGKIARQADGAVLATYGETVVLATVVSAKSPKPGQDFFPLTVNYQEKTYAAGKIPGGYFKREGRPSEKETLVSRLIDRPIRPLFPDGYKNDTQVVVTVVQHDLENDPDVLSMVATSAALTLSGIPFMGPVGGARVGYINGEYVLNPHLDEMDEVGSRSRRRRHAGRRPDGGIGSQGTERRRHARRRHVRPQGLPAGHRRDHQACRSGCQGTARLHAGRSFRTRSRNAQVSPKPNCALPTRSPRRPTATLPSTPSRPRSRLISSRKVLKPKYTDRSHRLPSSSTCRPRSFAGTSSTPRAASTVAISTRFVPIVSEVGILPRTHGSALFTRGETQAIVVATLGTGEDEQYVDSLTGMYKETLPSALQLPSLFGRRNRPHGLPGPPRNRPRQARMARDPSDAADC